jgi:hypothetical protein
MGIRLVRTYKRFLAIATGATGDKRPLFGMNAVVRTRRVSGARADRLVSIRSFSPRSNTGSTAGTVSNLAHPRRTDTDQNTSLLYVRDLRRPRWTPTPSPSSTTHLPDERRTEDAEEKQSRVDTSAPQCSSLRHPFCYSCLFRLGSWTQDSLTSVDPARHSHSCDAFPQSSSMKITSSKSSRRQPNRNLYFVLLDRTVRGKFDWRAWAQAGPSGPLGRRASARSDHLLDLAKGEGATSIPLQPRRDQKARRSARRTLRTNGNRLPTSTRKSGSTG